MKPLLSSVFLLSALAVAAAESSPEFVGVTTIGDRRMFMLQESHGGVVSDFLPQGATFRGFRIEDYDPKLEVLILRSGEKTVKVSLKESRVREGGTSAAGERQLVAVSGAVKKGGRFDLQAGGSLLAAIDAAGGFSDVADRKRVRITRRESAGSLRVFSVDCAEGKSPDFKVAVGDTIFVPALAR